VKLDLVDVFGARPLSGNPLGVVHGAKGLDGDAMLEITRWLGFSETTFLHLPDDPDPDADHRVRIFCPARELPFAGHPTLGSCHAWLAAGGEQRQDGVIVQQCGVGLVDIRRQDGMLAFRAPPLTRTGPLSHAERADAVRLARVSEEAVADAVNLVNGPNWQLLRLGSAEEVLADEPLTIAPEGTEIGLSGPWPEGSEQDWEVRGFFVPEQGRLVEDPVTGSLNARIATHLFGQGLAQGSYVAAQGRKKRS
jgi:PhzF family phenazine biosynthesis protein